MTESYWLVCPNSKECRRFTKNADNKDRFNEYIFIDSGIVTSIYGDKPPLMKTRREEKIEKARQEWQKLITQGWQAVEPEW
tara:strand:+ start:446 stop:688 length:243 start_codon:yes stop_codon:yes gene_type:complete